MCNISEKIWSLSHELNDINNIKEEVYVQSTDLIGLYSISEIILVRCNAITEKCIATIILGATYCYTSHCSYTR